MIQDKVKDIVILTQNNNPYLAMYTDVHQEVSPAVGSYISIIDALTGYSVKFQVTSDGPCYWLDTAVLSAQDLHLLEATKDKVYIPTLVINGTVVYGNEDSPDNTKLELFQKELFQKERIGSKAQLFSFNREGINKNSLLISLRADTRQCAEAFIECALEFLPSSLF